LGKNFNHFCVVKIEDIAYTAHDIVVNHNIPKSEVGLSNLKDAVSLKVFIRNALLYWQINIDDHLMHISIPPKNACFRTTEATIKGVSI
jgi:hypothetical protein